MQTTNNLPAAPDRGFPCMGSVSESSAAGESKEPMQTTEEQSLDWFTIERFKAWLAEQDGERSFMYTDCEACALASFAHETTSGKWSFGPNDFRPQDSCDYTPIPQWAIDLLRRVRFQWRMKFGPTDECAISVDALRAELARLEESR
jgi:hypothetical protein